MWRLKVGFSQGIVRFLIILSFVISLLPFSQIYARKLTQCFQVQKSCPAFQSFRKQTNPGNVYVNKGKSYSIIQKSKKGTHYRVRVEGIETQERWIESKCGIKSSQCGTSTRDKSSASIQTIQTEESGQYLLALSWMPTFCEARPNKKECKSLVENRYDATHLSLHGLWPQPRANAYCGVSDIDKGIDRNKRWHLLEPLKLSHETIKKLAFVMPGYASNLHRHEWVKHGTCYGTDADTYYQHSIELTQKVNQSEVGRLLSRNIGKKVTLKQIRKSFDKSFGKGAGKKVDLRCDRKGRISELWINLTGVIANKSAADLDVSKLMKSAINAGSSCFKGYVDRVD